ncbi:ABC transporter substrate-binding protein [Reinekea sp. G2M2-21]|uniref:substrate-binding periplasmic protein n=1 Tax=Reinekea sp. G2M2-21 TaxID=2788942 RepID=UPI0018AAD235|nr:transporter substrate-binding domain-containing protein [Reinekea sp. G2M2-21]
MRAVFLVVLIFFSQVVEAKPLVRFAIGDWPPYVSEFDPQARLLERLIREAYASQHLSVTFDYFPWKRSYEYVRQGEYDGTFPWNSTQQRRDDFLIHSVPLVQDNGVFFHLKSTPFDWQALTDIGKYRVGVVVGFKQQEVYRRLGIQAELIETEEAAFRMLMAGRIDVYQTSRLVGLTTARRLFTTDQLQRLTYHSRAVEVNTYFVLFAKHSSRSAELADALDAGLRYLQATGQYESLMFLESPDVSPIKP